MVQRGKEEKKSVTDTDTTYDSNWIDYITVVCDNYCNWLHLFSAIIELFS